MPYDVPLSNSENLNATVNLYTQPEDKRDALEAYLTFADFLTLARQNGFSMGSAMENALPHVNAILAIMKQTTEAAMGPLAGRSCPDDRKAIDAEIAHHTQVMNASLDPDTKLAERIKIARLEHEGRKIDTLWERFVSNEGTL